MSDGKEPLDKFVAHRIRLILADLESRGFPQDSLAFVRDQLRSVGNHVLSEHESDLQDLRSVVAAYEDLYGPLPE